MALKTALEVDYDHTEYKAMLLASAARVECVMAEAEAAGDDCFAEAALAMVSIPLPALR